MYQQNYDFWFNHPHLNPQLKSDMSHLDEATRQDAFYRDVEFGTAGMRGLLGPGPNRLNIHTIRRASDVFAQYLLKQFPEAKKRGIVIAHDNRLMSREFCLESAAVFANYQIKVYIFDALRPTPELSYAVRQLKAVGGIVITASHNPKEYNGYKVYDENGCQLTPDKITIFLKGYQDERHALDIITDPGLAKKYVRLLSPAIDRRYIQMVNHIRLRKQLPFKQLKVVYTPQHGAALQGVKSVLKKMGTQLFLVEEQCAPDPLFSQTKSPNPEEKIAFEKGLQLAHQVQADLVIATDPDGDRVGVAEKNGNDYELLTGNQTGAILLYYLLTTRQELKRLPANGIVFNTVVTSSIGSKVARSFGVHVESTLTGFKFIGEKIAQYEKSKAYQFLFGYEESYGYLLSKECRDKDAIQAVTMIVEMATYYQAQNKRLSDVLEEIYRRFGYHYDIQISLTLKGEEGLKKIQAIMQQLHQNPHIEFSQFKPILIEDYGTSKKIQNQLVTPLTLPTSDLVRWVDENEGFIAIRPSGTEPKCKFYFSLIVPSLEQGPQKVQQLYHELKQRLDIK